MKLISKIFGKTRKYEITKKPKANTTANPNPEPPAPPVNRKVVEFLDLSSLQNANDIETDSSMNESDTTLSASSINGFKSLKNGIKNEDKASLEVIINSAMMHTPKRRVKFQNNQETFYKSRYQDCKAKCQKLSNDIERLDDKIFYLKTRLRNLKDENRNLTRINQQRAIGAEHYMTNIQSMINDDSAEVTLQCQNKTFKVHKFILCSQSTIFRAMLITNDCLERTEMRVIINDSTSEAVKYMIEYLYSGLLLDKIDGNQVIEVLNLAEKYDLKPLKTFMEKKLMKKCDFSSVCYYYFIAFYYNCADLKKKILDIALSDFPSVTTTLEWKNLKLSHPKVAEDFLQALEASWSPNKPYELFHDYEEAPSTSRRFPRTRIA